MNIAFTWRETAFAAATQVIVVSANHNGLVFEFWIAAGQDADDVKGRGFAADDVHVKVERDSLTRKSQKIGLIYRRTSTIRLSTARTRVCNRHVNVKAPTFQIQKAYRHGSRNKHNGNSGLASVVIRKSRESIVFQLGFIRNNQKCPSAGSSRSCGLKTNLPGLHKLSVRIVAVRCPGEYDRDAILRVSAGIIIVFQFRR